jgi:hypothetical protein
LFSCSWVHPGFNVIKLFFSSSMSVRTGALLMRLCQPPDGSTSPKYKLLCFVTIKFFCKEKNALAFNRDRCCHLVLCLRLIPFHCPKPVLCIEIVVNTHTHTHIYIERANILCQGIAYTRSFDMGLTSIEGKVLCVLNNIFIDTKKI